ncbi:hypothetical protein TSUD_383570 [Trifolium subterraneum]|uniref:Uncharacterized protein n=1 Tax=Trifolium subterraneum TaxID=3900 RepID=A0A2Z6P8U5_TRISU|nr:hypothetical protein TSUD_383570 [Trifolium subterraneum]
MENDHIFSFITNFLKIKNCSPLTFPEKFVMEPAHDPPHDPSECISCRYRQGLPGDANEQKSIK